MAQTISTKPAGGRAMTRCVADRMRDWLGGKDRKSTTSLIREAVEDIERLSVEVACANDEAARWRGAATAANTLAELTARHNERLLAHQFAARHDPDVCNGYMRGDPMKYTPMCVVQSARIARLTEWMTAHGLLQYHDNCKRPDGTSGPAWVVRQPFMVAGDTCEAWHATSAAGAVDSWLEQ